MKSCPTCRAANLDSAVVCVGCGTAIGVVPMPGPLQHTPPETPPDPAAIEQEKARRARRAVIAAIVVGAVIVLAVAAGIVLLRRGDGFPATIAGKPRITSDDVKKVEELIEEQDIQGLSPQLAFYGTGGEPSIIVVVFRGTSDAFGEAKDSDAFWRSFGQGFSQGFASSSGGAVTSGKPLTVEKDGVRYFCTGFQGAIGQPFDGSMCLFVKDEMGLLLSTTFEDPADAVNLAEEAAAAL